MNAYCGEWEDDFNHIFHAVRERMKKDAYDILSDRDASIEKKTEAAENIIRSHFLRSAYTYIENGDKRRMHPSFSEYAAMMLNQVSYRENFENDIVEILINKYGTMEGIPYGSYYYGPVCK